MRLVWFEEKEAILQINKMISDSIGRMILQFHSSDLSEAISKYNNTLDNYYTELYELGFLEIEGDKIGPVTKDVEKLAEDCFINVGKKLNKNKGLYYLDIQFNGYDNYSFKLLF